MNRRRTRYGARWRAIGRSLVRGAPATRARPSAASFRAGLGVGLGENRGSGVLAPSVTVAGSYVNQAVRYGARACY